MKKLFAALLFAAAAIARAQTALTPIYVTLQPYAGGDPSASSGAVAVGDITGLGAGVAAWLATATCANLATAMTGETTGSCGALVFNQAPRLITPVIHNGATGPGYIDFEEDSDNGSNFYRFIFPSSMAANRNVTVPTLANHDTLAFLDEAQTFTNKTLTSPILVTPTVNNGATSAGCIRLAEDSDNGSNYRAICAQESLVGDRTMQVVTLPTSDIYADGYKPQIGFDPQTGFRNYDEFNCGPALAAAVSGSCSNLKQTGTNGGVVNNPSANNQDSGSAPGFVIMNTVDGDGIFSITTTQNANMLLTDKLHGKFRVGPGASGACTSNDCPGVIYVGSHDAAAATTAAPANGIWFQATDPNAAAAPNWFIAACDGTCAGGDIKDSGVAMARDTDGLTSGISSWTTLEYYYESGVGVHFYINGTETSNSPINTKLPTNANSDEFTWVNMKIARTAAGSDATTDLYLFVDYAFCEGQLSR